MVGSLFAATVGSTRLEIPIAKQHNCVLYSEATVGLFKIRNSRLDAIRLA